MSGQILICYQGILPIFKGFDVHESIFSEIRVGFPPYIPPRLWKLQISLHSSLYFLMDAFVRMALAPFVVWFSDLIQYFVTSFGPHTIRHCVVTVPLLSLSRLSFWFHFKDHPFRGPITRSFHAPDKNKTQVQCSSNSYPMTNVYCLFFFWWKPLFIVQLSQCDAKNSIATFHVGHVTHILLTQ